MSVDIEVERAKFEAWAITEDHDVHRFPISGRYSSYEVDDLFACWIAAKRDAAAERNAWNQSLAIALHPDLDAEKGE